MSRMTIGIIGAGAAGLAAAWEFANAGHDVTVYEAGDRVGGLAAGFQDKGWEWTLEKFYHHWFTNEDSIFALAEEMGVRGKIIFPQPKTSYWLDDKLFRSEIALSAVFLPLSPLSTIRLGLAGAYAKLSSDWKPFEKVTADAWLRRWMGDEAYEKLFRPLLIGKFAEQYDTVPMSYVWGRIVKRTRKIGTYIGGFQAFLDELARQLAAKGVTIQLHTRAERIGRQNGRLTIAVDGETRPFDRIISTTSPRLMLKLADGLADTAYGRQLAKLKSIGGLCVILALKKPLMPDDETYWLNLPAATADKSKNDFPFLVLIEHTNLVPRQHYGGDHIIYCGDYVPADHEYFQLSEEALVERFLPALRKINPDFNPDWVRQWWVWRAPYAQPVPELNHSRNIPALATPLPGLYWASMSQVYPWDRGTNYAVELGRQAAQEAMSQPAAADV